MVRFFKENKDVVFTCISLVLFECFIYFGIGIICLDFDKVSVDTKLDHYIPYVGIFVIPYVSWYIFILAGPFYLGIKDRSVFYLKYFPLCILMIIVAGLIFVLYPTYTPKQIITQNNIFDEIVIMLYKCDIRGNAFPSLHCSYSWLIFRSVKSTKNIEIKAKTLVLIVSLLICFSTVFIKQHGILDVFGGVFIVECLWAIYKFVDSECDINGKFKEKFLKK